MRTYDDHVILQTLDNPLRILFWNFDEFMVMTLPIFLGIVLGSLTVMLLGVPVKVLYSRARKGSRRGVSLQHRLYWHLPTSTLNRAGVVKKLPPSHVRDILL